MNTYQKLSNSGKPIINKQTKLPEYTRSIHHRLQAVKSQLGFNQAESRWSSICSEVKSLTI